MIPRMRNNWGSPLLHEHWIMRLLQYSQTFYLYYRLNDCKWHIASYHANISNICWVASFWEQWQLNNSTFRMTLTHERHIRRTRNHLLRTMKLWNSGSGCAMCLEPIAASAMLKSFKLSLQHSEPRQRSLASGNHKKEIRLQWSGL